MPQLSPAIGDVVGMVFVLPTSPKAARALADTPGASVKGCRPVLVFGLIQFLDRSKQNIGVSIDSFPVTINYRVERQTLEWDDVKAAWLYTLPEQPPIDTSEDAAHVFNEEKQDPSSC